MAAINAQASESQVQTLCGIKPDNIPDEVLNADRPIVLKGLVADWPAVKAAQAGKAAAIAYMREHCKNQQVMVFKAAAEARGRFFYNNDLSGFNFERLSASLDHMLSQFEALGDKEDDPACYIGSTSVDSCCPDFRKQNDLVLGSAASANNHGAGPLVSVWMGNQTRIAAHFDSPNNIACVTAGRRRFTLFAPEQLVNLYVGPLDFTPAGQAISLVDFHKPDFDRYPRFKEALKVAQVVELDAGDAIYIPSMWWHHVEALEAFNVLINYWWQAASVADNHQGLKTAPMDTMIHALLGIKKLPIEQRRAWQGLFNHYIFEQTPDLLSHIPDKAQGVLGEIDDATAKQLLAMLRRKLDK